MRFDAVARDARTHLRGRRRGCAVACAVAVALVLGGCATTPPGTSPGAPLEPSAAPPPEPPKPTAPPLPRSAEPPAPKLNLSGFPLPYRQGYADGCASATGPERKDATRFSSDMNYRTGWTDGSALCKKK